MLKLQCKTTFNSAFVGKKNHQNRTRVNFGIMRGYLTLQTYLCLNFTLTKQIKVKEQHFYCCFEFQSLSKVFNNEHVFTIKHTATDGMKCMDQNNLCLDGICKVCKTKLYEDVCTKLAI
jgi:hypothetical protein